MRTLGFLVVACLALLAASARADKRRSKHKADAQTTTTATATPDRDEPMPSGEAGAADPRVPGDTGQRREIDVTSPPPQSVETGPRTTRDRDVAPPPRSDASAGEAELSAELGARQLAKETRRHQRDIDACLAAAQRRQPSAAGTLTVKLTIADRKLASAVVLDNTVHDYDLDACLTRVARTFRFSLSAAEIAWPVTLTPSR
jgi:hypothetical protein